MSDDAIRRIEHAGKLIAIHIPASYRGSGVQFFTPGSFSQQLAYMRHPAGHAIRPHRHNLVQRMVEHTQEALFIRSGRLQVDLYTSDESYLGSLEARSGDVILLCSGGHGFSVLEEVEMVEVKQGPYAGEQDKTLFDGDPGCALRRLD